MDINKIRHVAPHHYVALTLVQVHGIIRRSSTFNTGRLQHLFNERHRLPLDFVLLKHTFKLMTVHKPFKC